MRGKVVRIRLEALELRADPDALRQHARCVARRRRSRFARSCSRASRPTAASPCPSVIRASRRRSSPRCAARLSRAGVRDPVALHRRHSGRGAARASSTRTYTAEIFGQRRDHAAADARAGPAPARACRTGRRSRSRTSRCSCSAISSSTCSRRQGRDAQHPRRHVRRHRQLGANTRCAASGGVACSCCRRTDA